MEQPNSPEHKIGPNGACTICGCSETSIRHFGWKCKPPADNKETIVPSKIILSVGRIRHDTNPEAIKHDGEAFTQAMRELMRDYYPKVDITDGKNLKLGVSEDTFTVFLDVNCPPSEMMKIQRDLLAAMKRQGFGV